jgi:hypothetical protein
MKEERSFFSYALPMSLSVERTFLLFMDDWSGVFLLLHADVVNSSAVMARSVHNRFIKPPVSEIPD